MRRSVSLGDIAHTVGLLHGLATLKCCAEFAGSPENLEAFYKWAAPRLVDLTGERSWGPGRIRYWLARECWGSGWVEDGTVNLTEDGRRELCALALREAVRARVLRGEMSEDEAEIWEAA